MGDTLMRNFETLVAAAIDTTTGVISFTAQGTSIMAMRREGEYLSITASYGALEIALRLRFPEFVRILTHLQPNDGLITTRQIGTGDAFLALGKRLDGSLVLRPTIVGDASGYFCLNLTLTPQAASALSTWLNG
jgi:hypothetical protein